MGKTAGYLNRLLDLKAALAENLNLMGVSSSADELFDTLIPKVTQIKNKALLDELVGKTITEYSSDSTELKDYTFYKCDKLHTVNMPNIQSIGQYCFYYVNVLSNINVSKVITVGVNAFVSAFKENVIYLELPELVTLGGDSEFRNNAGIKSFKAPKLKNLSQQTFAYNANCEEYFLPLAEIMGKNTFLSNISLVSLSLPSIKQINGTNVFKDCGALTSLILAGEYVASLGSTTSFTNTPIANGTGYIYVPSALVNDYKGATNWSAFADQIRALEDYPEVTV